MEDRKVRNYHPLGGTDQTEKSGRRIPATKLLVFTLLSIVPLCLIAPALVQGVRDSSDLTRHYTWLEQFHSQLAMGIAYPRWLAECADGFGEPVFMYYAPGFYYLGSLLMFLGLSPLSSIIAIVMMAYVFVGQATYRFLAPVFGNFASFIGAVLTQLAPTTFILFFGRYAPARTLAVPIALFTIFEAVRNREEHALLNRRIAVGIALTIAVHILTGFMVLLILAVLFIPIEEFILRNWSKYRRRVSILFFSLVSGIGLSSAYLLPALLTKRHLSDSAWLGGQLDYRLHFALPMPINLNAEYFAKSSSAIIILIMLSISAAGLALAFRRKQEWPFRLPLVRLWSVSLVALMMATSASSPVWEKISALHLLQIPTRFLAIAGPLSIIIVFALIMHLRDVNRTKTVTICLLVALTLAPCKLAVSYIYNIGKVELNKFDERRVDRGITSSEYVPPAARHGRFYENRFAFEDACATAGWVCREVKQPERPLPSWSITVPTRETIVLPHYYYPTLRAFVDDKLADSDLDPDTGLIRVSVPTGSHLVELAWEHSPEEIVGAAISVLASLILLYPLRRRFGRVPP